MKQHLHLACLVLLGLSVLVKGQIVDPSEVKYYLYNRDHLETHMEMMTGDLNGADFAPWKSVHYIVHSDGESSSLAWVRDMKLNALVGHDTNLVLVDWTGPAGGSYAQAVQRSQLVGRYLGEFITFLATQGGNMSTSHCIGFGLGAHVCGHAGSSQTGTPLGRISGLDPVRDRINYDVLGERLDEGDAAFVDVIHTCGGNVGFSRQMGHVDFFPNDGEDCDQPGCGIFVDGKCSHERSHAYFSESFTTDRFVSRSCNKWGNYNSGDCDFNEAQPMGDRVDHAARGYFYLHTRDSPPYALG